MDTEQLLGTFIIVVFMIGLVVGADLARMIRKHIKQLNK